MKLKNRRILRKSHRMREKERSVLISCTFHQMKFSETLLMKLELPIMHDKNQIDLLWIKIN